MTEENRHLPRPAVGSFGCKLSQFGGCRRKNYDEREP